MNLWNWIDKTSTFFGIITAVPVFWAWFILLRWRQRQKRIVENIGRAAGDGRKTAMAEILKSAFGKDQFKKACKKKKKWALSIRELLKG
jgi:hypothetical protein